MGVKDRFRSFLQAISTKIAYYPYPNQREVQTTYPAHSEDPDPLPNVHHDVSNPVSVSFNDYYYQDVSMLSFKLFYDANDTEITDTILLDKANDPNRRFSKFDFALYANKPFDVNTTYRVEIRYIADGVEGSKVWKFTTASTPN